MNKQIIYRRKNGGVFVNGIKAGKFIGRNNKGDPVFDCGTMFCCMPYCTDEAFEPV